MAVKVWQEEKGRSACAERPLGIEVTGELENLVHAAHAACAGGSGGGRLLVVFLDVSDEGFGGEHQARDRRCVLQRDAGDLRRGDNAPPYPVPLLSPLVVAAL